MSNSTAAQQSTNAGRLRARLIEHMGAQPAHVRGGPGTTRVALATAQQELRETVAGTHQIATEIVDRAYQITEALIRGRRHEREPQFPGGQQPHEADRIAAVGLDPVPRTFRDRPGRHDLHHDPSLARRAHQPEPGRPGLVDRTHPRSELPQEPRPTALAPTRNRRSRSSPLPRSSTAACVWRACTSRPTRHVAFTDMVGSSRRGQGAGRGTSRATTNTPHDRVGDRPCLPAAPDVNPHRA